MNNNALKIWKIYVASVCGSTFHRDIDWHLLGLHDSHDWVVF